ncbi:membrane hypothetical protein [groundwater metagenome]|uniref:Glycerophosphoryl diester phosphodiesterase membrane domain-containing protein n=1 Tax=groundwater metagenome TaxID=717931 RepID=A0A098EAC5_9ZZZZ
MDFVEPLVYPLKDIKKLVLGGLMILPGMFLLLIPLIMESGYIIRVAGDTIRGKNDLPEFDRWWALFIKGLGSVLIDIVYLLMVIVLFLPAILCFVIGGGSYNTAIMVFSIIFLIIMIVPAIVLAIMELIAYAKYGEKENIVAAFKFNEIYRNLRTNMRNYIIGTLIFFGLFICFYILVSILELILMLFLFGGILGIIFGIMLIFPIIGVMVFYFSLFTMRMYAQIYKESKGKLGESTLQPEPIFIVPTGHQGKNNLGNRDEWEELK